MTMIKRLFYWAMGLIQGAVISEAHIVGWAAFFLGIGVGAIMLLFYNLFDEGAHAD